MTELLKWIVTSGNQFSAGGILAVLVVIIPTALYREWIVTGPTHKECKEDLKAFREEAKVEALANQSELIKLREEIADLRDKQSRRRQ